MIGRMTLVQHAGGRQRLAVIGSSTVLAGFLAVAGIEFAYRGDWVTAILAASMSVGVVVLVKSLRVPCRPPSGPRDARRDG